MLELNNFEALQIGLVSSEKIREWSRGEVKKPETINYRTLKPERDGLFCERIFGPTKDWECHCGKYKRVRYKGIVCDRCGVEVTKAKVRRERMGHIELAAPVSHIWYFRGIPSRLGLILDISPRALEKVLYFASYIVTNPKETTLLKKQLLSEKEFREAIDKFGEGSFVAGMGAEVVKDLLSEIDLEQLSSDLRDEVKKSSGQKKVRIIRRLEVVESFRKSKNKPEWMIIEVIPVIPPDLRPMVQLDGGRFATSDLNDLYRRVINRNNRLKKLLDLKAPDIIVRNEKRMLQESVDALIDNGRRGRPVTGPGNRPLKSLSDMLKGKQGRFRQNLLGKRVDYSGRSVIVVGPELKMYQCGLPKEMALELFKPFVMKKLVTSQVAHNMKNAKRMVERVHPQVWDILEEVIEDHPVLLNRAPTLHRLGIQAFQPVLVEGRAIKLHPLTCNAYNADFDGDQMAVHVPLSVEAQTEARFLMLAANNILKPSDGRPVCVPTQDMVLGSYYLTFDNGKDEIVNTFSSTDEALLAYESGNIKIQDKIKVKVYKQVGDELKHKLIVTTAGKIIFNESIPQDLGFVDRTNPDEMFNMEIEGLATRKYLEKIIERCYLVHGPTQTSIMLDNIKSKGYHYSTIGALTVSTSDMVIPKQKKEMLQEAEAEVDKIERLFRRGFISDEERYERVIDTWAKTTDKVGDMLMNNLDRYNSIFMMADSGARGSKSQIKQLAGMRGLMASPSGKIMERPIKASLREGLDVLEYFISTHGARKGNADTALKTADSGYLTRRLVDVSQDVIVREEDCNTTEGFVVSEIREGNEIIESLVERLTGRYTAEDVIDPKTNEIIVGKGEYIDFKLADKISKADIKKVNIRSVFTCKTRHGVCSKCYGMSMATAKQINVGEAVGIIAAQSIGEPGTQLTMRTFHTGGVAGGADITQGLPRVEELFEARKPKGLAIVSEQSGTVRIEETKKKRIVYITTENNEEFSYEIPFGSRIKVIEGSFVAAGDEITEGSVNPHDTIRIKGVQGVKNYLLGEVQKVYRLQGVEINDKHLEIVIRQMTKKIKIDDAGDTEFLSGSLVDEYIFNEENEKAISEGLMPAQGKVSLLGITRAALATDSFLSAASFQETTKVLTDAATKGKIDPLLGLKENVIIGKLIPAGTGLKKYSSIKINTEIQEYEEEFQGN
ncbi:MAG: DNA-directed RNA polymerase subunit beta' [Oscillospiraceae bacterium]|nr:DNA-directed RNA polymerase subunit beta' [Oscillospiraceae bacterium]